MDPDELQATIRVIVEMTEERKRAPLLARFADDLVTFVNRVDVLSHTLRREADEGEVDDMYDNRWALMREIADRIDAALSEPPVKK